MGHVAAEHRRVDANALRRIEGLQEDRHTNAPGPPIDELEDGIALRIARARGVDHAEVGVFVGQPGMVETAHAGTFNDQAESSQRLPAA